MIDAAVSSVKLRSTLDVADCTAIGDLVASTGFFSRGEVALAVELVAETIARGGDSGYQFLIADSPYADHSISAYTCFGRIPATESSFDLYWIAVAPGEQGKGAGRDILLQTELVATEQGATKMFVDTSGRPQYAATRAFYERMGYSVAARLEDFYAPGDSKVIYGKSLPS
jgi:GNAT superfamily N-acetyltransferase